MYCGNCGAKSTTAEDGFCGNCGAKFTVTESSDAAKPKPLPMQPIQVPPLEVQEHSQQASADYFGQAPLPMQVNSVQSPPQQKRSGKRWLGVVAIIAFTLLVIGGGVFALIQFDIINIGNQPYINSNEPETGIDYDEFPTLYYEQVFGESDTTTSMEEMPSEAWRDLYAELLRKYVGQSHYLTASPGNRYINEFMLYDISSDGIPELIMFWVYDWDYGWQIFRGIAAVYTYRDGEVLKLDIENRDGNLIYQASIFAQAMMSPPEEKEGIIFIDWWETGVSYQLFTLVGNKLTFVLNGIYGDASYNYPHDAYRIVYDYANLRYVAQSEFRQIFGDHRNAITPFEINDLNISAKIFHLAELQLSYESEHVYPTTLDGVIFGTTHWVRINVLWTNGETTIFERDRDALVWTMRSRQGFTRIVEPIFFISPQGMLSMGFPTTNNVYMFNSDFSGSFGGEALTWSFESYPALSRNSRNNLWVAENLTDKLNSSYLIIIRIYFGDGSYMIFYRDCDREWSVRERNGTSFARRNLTFTMEAGNVIMSIPDTTHEFMFISDGTGLSLIANEPFTWYYGYSDG